MNYSAHYDARKRTPEHAISLIQNDDVILVAGRPGALLGALDQAKGRFDGLRLFSVFGLDCDAGAGLCSPEAAGHVLVSSAILSKHEENAWLSGSIDQAPVHLSAVDEFISDTCRPTVLFVHCPPPDDEGYFYPGIDSGGVFTAVQQNARIMVQVNPNMPLIYSDTRFHVTKADVICESAEPVPGNATADEADEAGKAIAGFVAELIPDGATIQLGAGLLPELVGKALLGHKDLGIHTDYFNGAMIDLIKKGAVNNSKKAVLPGVSVGSYFNVPAAELKFLEKNPEIVSRMLSWACRSSVISQNDKVRAVNEGIAVDFRAQASTCNLGMSFTGGVGGAFDFFRGAQRCNDGLSFIVMKSTAVGKDGAKTSRILPAMPDGSLVSIPRSDMMYVVTEYGAVNVRDLTIKERVRSLIGLAHPDFRDWLSDEAAKNGYS
ncbi:MAG: hypothetical protein FWG28_03310 [Clostridiales bacterium]|nr:hypothetical protein [Clostridiales bacterium]